MKCVIIESPYSGEVARNERYAERALLDCLRRDEAPIASHLLFTRPGVLDDTKPEERRLGMQAGHAWIKKADAMVVYTDYGVSSGMQTALIIAARMRIPVERRKIGPNPGDDYGPTRTEMEALK